MDRVLIAQWENEWVSLSVLPITGFNSRPLWSISRNFALADQTMPTRPEPAWQSLLNGTKQPVGIKELKVENQLWTDNGWKDSCLDSWLSTVHGLGSVSGSAWASRECETHCITEELFWFGCQNLIIHLTRCQMFVTITCRFTNKTLYSTNPLSIQLAPLLQNNRTCLQFHCTIIHSS